MFIEIHYNTYDAYNIHIYIYKYIDIPVCSNINIYIYIYLYIYIYICIYKLIYIYTHVYTYCMYSTTIEGVCYLVAVYVWNWRCISIHVPQAKITGLGYYVTCDMNIASANHPHGVGPGPQKGAVLPPSYERRGGSQGAQPVRGP